MYIADFCELYVDTGLDLQGREWITYYGDTGPVWYSLLATDKAEEPSRGESRIEDLIFLVLKEEEEEFFS